MIGLRLIDRQFTPLQRLEKHDFEKLLAWWEWQATNEISFSSLALVFCRTVRQKDY
jgi:hypothetical protein